MSDRINVKTTNEKSKVYIEIVNQLRSMIKEDHLNPGDKLPSERELSERLSVGRSSVREALRALELLGLIETKRGEGTFIRDFKGHQLIPLISTFVLQDEQSKKDVMETKYLIEKDCLTLLIKRVDPISLQQMLDQLESPDHVIDDDSFFVQIIQLANNYLLLRIWIILTEYFNSLKLNKHKPKKEQYVQLLKALSLKDMQQTFKAYQSIRGMSKDC